jgi:hypothetical protein
VTPDADGGLTSPDADGAITATDSGSLADTGTDGTSAFDSGGSTTDAGGDTSTPPPSMFGVPCGDEVCLSGPGDTTSFNPDDYDVCCQRGGLGVVFACESWASCRGPTGEGGGIAFQCDGHEDCPTGEFCFGYGGSYCGDPEEAGIPETGDYVHKPLCHDLEGSSDCNAELPSPGLARCCVEVNRPDDGIFLYTCQDDACSGG